MKTIPFACVNLVLSVMILQAAPRTSPLIIDHTYPFKDVPEAKWEELRNAHPLTHYAHRSDGSAVPFGLDRLNSIDPDKWPSTIQERGLPTITEGLGLWDGMTSETYATPDKYWTTKAARDDLTAILNGNPSIQYASWTWCNEDDYWPIGPSQSDNNTLADYFRIMDSLEQKFPNVTFIYQTAAMRADGGDEQRLNQAAFNDSLRSWAIANNKVLFDFADLDVWHNGDAHTVTIGEETIPFQHPAWLEGTGATNGGHHANDSMGIDKGIAWWTMMVMLETGWAPSGTTQMRTRPVGNRNTIPWLTRQQFDLLGRTQ